MQEQTSGSSGSLPDFLRLRGLSVPEAGPSGSTAHAIWRQGGVGAAELADAVAAFHDLPRAHRETVLSFPPLTDSLSRRFLQEAFLYPVQAEAGPLVLTADPAQGEAIEAVRLALNRQAPLAVLSFDEIAELLTRDGAVAAPRDEAGGEVAPDVALFDDIETLQDLARGAPVVRAIDDLFARALDAGATDIHLETAREELRIRFRIDGLLRAQQSLPRHISPPLQFHLIVTQFLPNFSPHPYTQRLILPDVRDAILALLVRAPLSFIPSKPRPKRPH